MVTKRLLVILFPFLLLVCSCTPLPNPSQPPRFELRSVVALVHEDGDAYCSGVQLREGVLTAAHCVDGAQEALIAPLRAYSPEDNLWHRIEHARVLRVDVEHDLALLDYHNTWDVGVAQWQPAIGTPVWVVGHAMGLGYTVHQGIVSSMERHWEDPPQDWFQTDAGLIGGMSGGPVFNEHAEVVGIVSFSMGTFLASVPHLGGCVATDAIHAFLEDR